MLAMYCKTPSSSWFYCGQYSSFQEVEEFQSQISSIIEWYLQPWFVGMD